MAKAIILFALLFCTTIKADTTRPWPGPGQINKGAVTHKELLDLYLERMALWIRACEEKFGWNEATGKWGTQPMYNEEYYAGYVQLYLAADGSDEQVAMSGLSRDTLFARVDRYRQRWGWSKLQTVYTRAKNGTLQGYDTVVASQLALARDRAPTWNLKSNDTIFLAFNPEMDYFRTAGCITGMPVVQDFADPRIIAGKPIKEWFRQWDRTTHTPITSGGRPPAPCYAPDFSGDHHGIVNIHYHNFGLFRDTYNRLAWNIMTAPQNNHAGMLSPYSHHMDMARHNMLLSSGDGTYGAPMGLEYGVYFNYPLSYTASVYKSALSHAFLARGMYGIRALPSFGWNKRIAFSLLTMGDASVEQRLHSDFVSSYEHVRFAGKPDTVISYAEAARQLHGSYWYRYFRFGVHRTPDKVVVHGWRGTSRTGLQYPSTQPPTTPISWDTWKNRTRAEKARSASAGYEGKSTENLRVTLITPDNDSLRPSGGDGDLFFTRSFGGITGTLYSQVDPEITSRCDQSDGVMGTAARIYRLDAQAGYQERAVSYHALVSLYDKTTIAFTRILPGAGGIPTGSWQRGFGSSFYVDPHLPYQRDLHYEGGIIDLKAEMAPHVSENNVQTTINSYVKPFSSNWWCFNGRLGLATIGGTGNFSIGFSKGQTQDLWGANVGYNQPLASGTVKVDMSAAYYTDTPPEKVKALQTTLVSLDGQLPIGWKGVVSETPDSQRVLALVRFYGDNGQGQLSLSYAEGAPIFERLTTISGTTSTATFDLDTLESFGQTMAFYVLGNATQAEQIGDIEVRLKGNGAASLVYLSRANSNTVYINGIPQSQTKSSLRAGITLNLTDSWTSVRIDNPIDDDHSGPSVEIVSPQFLTDEQCKFFWGSNTWEPDPVFVDILGLDVKIKAKDRSGVAYVDLYMNEVTYVGRDSSAPFEINIPAANFVGEPIHSLKAIAYDKLGNKQESFVVTCRVALDSGITSVERATNGAITGNTVSLSNKGVRHDAISRTIQQTVTPKSVSVPVISERVSGVDAWVARGRVQPQNGISAAVSGMSFEYANVEYVFGLDVSSGKAVLFRKGNNGISPIGDAACKVKSGSWYDLKVQISDGKIVGYVNNKERLTLIN